MHWVKGKKNPNAFWRLKEVRKEKEKKTRSLREEEDIICNRQREVNGHTVTNEILCL
jgi:hypothetical protein